MDKRTGMGDTVPTYSPETGYHILFLPTLLVFGAKKPHVYPSPQLLIP